MASRWMTRGWMLTTIYVACAGGACTGGVKKDVPYVATPDSLVEQMLSIAQVKPSDVVYDLGCGDGRIVITAARQYGARGVGVEIDPKLIEKCHQNAAEAGVTDRVKFVNQDLFTMDFSEATVLTLYLLPKLNLRLRPRILDLKPGTRIVSHAWDMGDWEPDHIIGYDSDPMGSRVYFWTVPAKVQDTWSGVLKIASGDEPMGLSLSQRYQRVRGIARIGGKNVELRGVNLRGDRLTFILPPGVRGSQAISFDLKVGSPRMVGTAMEEGVLRPIECEFRRPGEYLEKLMK